jgi:hypothetical protein
VSLADGEDWIMRPVVEGCCSYESLINGTLDLEGVARMNAALEVKHENQRRRQEREAKKDG